MDGKDNKIESNSFMNLSGNLIDFSIPRIMGIVNVNDNSFYDGSRAIAIEDVLRKVEQHLKEGADIIDLGAISTRPGADLESSTQEIERLIPTVNAVSDYFPNALLSIDTFRSDVAKLAVKEGAHMINDVYAGRYDGEMFEIIAKLKVPYVLMHSRGFSHDMNEKTGYKHVAKDVVQELSGKLLKLRNLGVKDIIIDPGFGFAKTLNENYELLNNLELLSTLGCPILAGVSRKSMIYKKLGVNSEESLNGTTVLNTLAYTKGAKIFRVHDVKPVKEMINLLN
jgi:dihydropteroate synthase